MLSHSAQERAFSISEILEAILLEIPPRDLLVDVQRVSRIWYGTINASPALQQLLFFEQRPRSRNCAFEFSPLLSEAFHPFFNHDPSDEDHPRWTQESLSRIKWNSSAAKIDAYSREEASWRRMLVVQPPIARLGIVRSCSSMTGLSKIEGKTIMPDGVRMGALYDLVEEEAHAGLTFDSTDFDLEWHLPSPHGKTPSSVSRRCIPPDARDPNGSVTVYIIRSESCVNVQREDYQPPDLTGLETDEEREEATLKAYMSNARPHLVSKARAPIHFEWGKEKHIRRWR